MEDNTQNQHGLEKSLKGYKTIIIILSVILVGISGIYFMQLRDIKGNAEMLRVQRDTLTNRLSDLIVDYDELKVQNDTITANLAIERHRADSILTRLKNERSWNYAKIKKYEQELGTLRTIMKSYVNQIDSLDRVNKKLVSENITYRKEIATQRMRAESAEEKASEMSSKLRKGEIIRARDIRLVTLNKNDKEVTRANRAAKLRVDFVLTMNDIATPGNRPIYVRITAPDGYVMSNSARSIFDYEGESLTYTAVREVDYQNNDLGVNIYYEGPGIVAGKYGISVYMDGYLIGESQVIVK